jgi:hypothetical protein
VPVTQPGNALVSPALLGEGESLASLPLSLLSGSDGGGGDWALTSLFPAVDASSAGQSVARALPVTSPNALDAAWQPAAVHEERDDESRLVEHLASQPWEPRDIWEDDLFGSWELETVLDEIAQPIQIADGKGAGTQ